MKHSLPFPWRILTAASLLLSATLAAQDLKLTPYHANSIYRVGEKAGWTVTAEGTADPVLRYRYTLKKNDLEVIQSGAVEPDTSGKVRIEAVLDEPAMLHLDLVRESGKGEPIVAGAAVAPTELRPTAARPADFDAFWEGKIKLLEAIPAEPVLTPGDSGREGVEYATVRMNNIAGSHIYGQLAKPAREGKFPAMLLLQWAGGPYPLQKAWVTDRAAEGWLVLNIEPHDVPGNLPQAFYDALPQLIKSYNSIYDDDRDRNYFLRMYLGAYRAADYLASRPDWNGNVLVATGTSMGGQQSLAVAGLHPRITHLVVHVPAGADSNGGLHGRLSGYPNWDSSRPQVIKTALYFDTVNFASRIRATSLVSMGFLDEVCPPAGIWTAFNQIPGKKEVVPLPLAKHNHQSTPEQQRPYTERSTAWFQALAHGEEPALRDGAAPGTY